MAASLSKSVECLFDSGYSVLGSALGEGESGGSAFDESAIVGQLVRGERLSLFGSLQTVLIAELPAFGVLSNSCHRLVFDGLIAMPFTR
jgi:hypothetical protein